MMRPLIISLLLLLPFAQSANAQFGDLLKSLNEVSKVLEQGLPNQEQEEQPKEESYQEKYIRERLTGVVTDPVEYCKRITGSPSIQKLNQALIGYGEGVTRLSGKHTYLDNKELALTKWVGKKLQGVQELYQQQSIEVLTEGFVARVVNDCAAKNPNLYSFLSEKERELNSEKPEFFSTEPHFYRWIIGGRAPRFASLVAFFFDGAEEEIQKISPDPTISFKFAADVDKQTRDKLAEEAQKEAVANAQAEAKRAKKADFEASPEGRLLYAYQNFQVIQTCDEVRKGYAVLFVNSEEMNEYKKQIRMIESKLKNSIADKDTDRIWQTAERNNRNSIAGDIIEMVKTYNKTNFAAAKQICDTNVIYFQSIAKKVLGNSPMKKSF